MACSLTITDVTGIPDAPGSTTTSTIRVTGTLSGDCRPIIVGSTSFDVVVEVDCGNGPVNGATQSQGGNWTIDIKAVCSCGTNIVVTASCATDPSCTDTFGGILECQEGVCPVATIDVAVNGCNPDGTRSVTLTANVTTVGGGPVVAQWNYGDGTLGAAFVISGPGTYTEGPHGYAAPGSYSAQFVYVLPEGCPPLPATVSGLESCPGPGCPEIVSVTASPAGVCNADATRTISLNAVVTGGPAQAYHWEFGTPDSADVTIDATVPGATPATSHAYPAPGTGTSNYTATFTVTGIDPSCVDTRALAVSVAGCGGACPTIGSVTAEVGTCTPAGTRSVALVAEVIGGGATQYQWQFGDGTSQTIDPTITSDPATSHNYAAPGSYTATFTLSGPGGCPDQSASTSFEVPACDGGGNGDGDGNPWFCGSLLFLVGGLIAIATAATIFTLALQICPALATVPVPGWVWGIVAGLWIAVAAALVLWALLCTFGICDCPTRCDWVAIGWIASLAATVVGLYLQGCCGAVWWVLVIGFGLAFAAAFVYWLFECRPGLCQVFDLLLVALSAIAATAIAYIAAVPLIMACGHTWVEVTVASIVAVLAVAVPVCHASE